MKISKNTIASIEYTLRDDEGEIIDSSEGDSPLEVLVGQGQLIPGLEKALMGLEAGKELKISVNPEEAYGDYNPELEVVVPMSQIKTDDEIEEGVHFQVDTPDGTLIYEVQKIEGDQVTMNGNHPLAGQVLHFEVKVVSVRAATEEELKHGHAHSEGGCEHH